MQQNKDTAELNDVEHNEELIQPTELEDTSVHYDVIPESMMAEVIVHSINPPSTEEQTHLIYDITRNWFNREVWQGPKVINTHA